MPEGGRFVAVAAQWPGRGSQARMPKRANRVVKPRYKRTGGLLHEKGGWASRGVLRLKVENLKRENVKRET